MLTGGLNTPMTMPRRAQVEAELGARFAHPRAARARQPRPAIRSGRQEAQRRRGPGPIQPGAGDGDGFGLARFGEGGEVIRGVQVKVGDPQFTLIWNTDKSISTCTSSSPAAKRFSGRAQGKLGGELDVDNTKGYGPENVYWLVETDGPGSEKVKGPGPAGVYKWFVVYWGGFGGIAKPTHWQVRVKHAGQVQVHHGKFSALNERSKIYTLKVDPPPGGKPVIPALPDPDAGGDRSVKRRRLIRFGRRAVGSRASRLDGTIVAAERTHVPHGGRGCRLLRLPRHRLIGNRDSPGHAQGCRDTGDDSHERADAELPACGRRFGRGLGVEKEERSIGFL